MRNYISTEIVRKYLDEHISNNILKYMSTRKFRRIFRRTYFDENVSTEIFRRQYLDENISANFFVAPPQAVGLLTTTLCWPSYVISLLRAAHSSHTLPVGLILLLSRSKRHLSLSLHPSLLSLYPSYVISLLRAAHSSQNLPVGQILLLVRSNAPSVSPSYVTSSSKCCEKS